jgi:hypothetical protein
MPPCIADDKELERLANALREIASMIDRWRTTGLPEGTAHPELAVARQSFEAIAQHLGQAGNRGQNLNRELVVRQLGSMLQGPGGTGRQAPGPAPRKPRGG